MYSEMNPNYDSCWRYSWGKWVFIIIILITKFKEYKTACIYAVKQQNFNIFRMKIALLMMFLDEEKIYWWIKVTEKNKLSLWNLDFEYPWTWNGRQMINVNIRLIFGQTLCSILSSMFLLCHIWRLISKQKKGI